MTRIRDAQIPRSQWPRIVVLAAEGLEVARTSLFVEEGNLRQAQARVDALHKSIASMEDTLATVLRELPTTGDTL